MGVENASSSAATKREFDEPAGGPDLNYTVSGSDGITRFGPQTVTGPWYMPPAYISGGTSDPPLYSPASVRRNVVTFTRTLTCSATATAQSIPEASGSLSYTVGIHAQPYDFHQTQVIDNGNGTLKFTYFWLSTDGKIGDLDPDCLVHEYVTYPGGNPYTPPVPFIVVNPATGTSAGLENPTIAPTPKLPGSVGILTDNQLFGGNYLLGVAKPYQSQQFTATQTYEFDDSATNQTNQQIPGPDSGPLSITRTIGIRPPYIPYWWYSVTKNGTTAWTSLPNQ